ncbi:MAG: HypC/HybG/HupF family hydrogenase formation chaperone [Candidatus Aenigmarchaeota archaeon]|nr:HypC/HybG/HupF family hydrogenase formation chaperone [Candidatus Aenigmarchaeota archaeon]
MCIAIPGKVLEIKGKKIIVDFSGKSSPAESHFVKVRKGDWVLVFGNYIVEKTTEKRAKEIQKTLKVGI